MSKFPHLNALSMALINDCYIFLEKHSDNFTKNSLVVLLKDMKNYPEIIQKSYAVLCSIYYIEPSEKKYPIIFNFTKGYFYSIYLYFSNINKELKEFTSAIDFCYGYLALFGYTYIFQEIEEKNLLQFSFNNYQHFALILKIYNISKEVQKYYEESYNSLIKTKKINNDFFLEYILNFKDESLVKFDSFKIIQGKETAKTKIQPTGIIENAKSLTKNEIKKEIDTKENDDKIELIKTSYKESQIIGEINEQFNQDESSKISNLMNLQQEKKNNNICKNKYSQLLNSYTQRLDIKKNKNKLNNNGNSEK